MSVRAQFYYYGQENGNNGSYGYQNYNNNGFSMPNTQQYYYYSGPNQEEMMRRLNAFVDQFMNRGFNQGNNIQNYNFDFSQQMPRIVVPNNSDKKSYTPEAPDISPAPDYQTAPDLYY